MKEIEIGKGKLIIPKSVFDTISIMHVGHYGKEWSGVPFFRITNGSLDDPSNLEITVVDIKPMNLGTTGYTEFDFDTTDPYYAVAIEKTYDDPTLFFGCWHSHHSMATFFSSTDTTDLHKNAKESFVFYFSGICNYSMQFEKDWMCKVSQYEKVEVTQTITETKFGNRKRYRFGFGTPIDEAINETESKEITVTEEVCKVITFDIVRGEGNWDDIDRFLYLKTSHNNYVGDNKKEKSTNTTTIVDRTQVMSDIKNRNLKGGLFKNIYVLGFVWSILDDCIKTKLGTVEKGIISNDLLTKTFDYAATELTHVEQKKVDYFLGDKFKSKLEDYLQGYNDNKVVWLNKEECEFFARLIVYYVDKLTFKNNQKLVAKLKAALMDHFTEKFNMSFDYATLLSGLNYMQIQKIKDMDFNSANDETDINDLYYKHYMMD